MESLWASRRDPDGLKQFQSDSINHFEIVARCRSPNPCLPQQQDTIPYSVKTSVLRSWRWEKDCPKHVELILEINKLLLLHLVGFYMLLYLNGKSLGQPQRSWRSETISGWFYKSLWNCATLPLSEPLPTTTTGHYTIGCKNLSLRLLKMGKRLPETCWADLGEQ